MTRTDHAVIGGLVLVLALIAIAIGAPAFAPARPLPSRPPEPQAALPYREAMLGRPSSVSPLSARTQVDRDLVALAFAGLVRIGPGGTIVGDLASRWTVDPAGTAWTFNLRRDATWHDGEPVTASDVIFTIGTLRDPKYVGPGGGSWREVTATALDEQTVRFQLATPLGGFLYLATQPIAPAHLLSGVPIDALSDAPFGQAPIGSGPFAIVELDEDHAVLEAAASAGQPAVEGSGPEGSAIPSDALSTPAPTKRPSVPSPRIGRLEFRFFDDPDLAREAFGREEIDAVSGLAPSVMAELARSPTARALRYPGTTLTTVMLNLRPDHPELRDPGVRAALLGGIDRSGLIDTVFAGYANQADSPIPPTSWAYDRVASPVLAHDPAAAAAALKKAGWKKVKDRWRPAAAKKPYTIQLVRPSRLSSPLLFAAADRVATDWQNIGLNVELVDAEAGTLLTGHLQEGRFGAAILDVSIGHDPDLYPLLASSQTRSGGLNVIGLQDATLDPLLVNARKPGTDEERKQAYAALQAQLTAGRYILPLCFADEVVVVNDRVRDVVPQPVGDRSDRFWDVLTWRLANDR